MKANMLPLSLGGQSSPINQMCEKTKPQFRCCISAMPNSIKQCQFDRNIWIPDLAAEFQPHI